ncbi:hypothetical protein TNCV_2617651 [Trichonephila clavipes]|nr:hypothetical protein TNCV_2617651 [Trichonephila clavipes]
MPIQRVPHIGSRVCKLGELLTDLAIVAIIYANGVHSEVHERTLAGVGLSESARCHGPGLALLTNGCVQQQQQQHELIGWKLVIVFIM